MYVTQMKSMLKANLTHAFLKFATLTSEGHLKKLIIDEVTL